jgi:PAS domain S-box-containing protein
MDDQNLKPARCLRVLLSEDREDDALLIVDELVQAGYQIEWKRVEAPDEMRALLSAESWDLIIADYDLPRFSAMGALEIVKENGFDIPFLIISGAMREIDAVAGMRAGVHDYLLKGNLARLGVVVDRELREAELRRDGRAAEVMLRRQAQVLDQVHDAIIQMDLHGHILKWNRGAERLFGYSEPEVLGQLLTVIFFDDDADEVVPPFFEHLKQDERLEKEVRSRHKSGSELWMRLSLSLLRDERGKPYGSAVYAQDVTERRRAENALRTSEEQYRLLTESLPQMVCLARDGANPQVMEFCNSQTHDFTGLTREQLLAGEWHSVIHPEDQARYVSETIAGQRSGAAYELQYRIRRAEDQTWRLHFARCIPIKDSKGGLRWLATIIDMEDQARAEEALRKTEKLAAVGRLASSIAHEINNPLEAVTNLVYLLQATSLTDQQRTYVQLASEELARVSHIVSHTLRFHRQSSFATEVNPAEIIDSVLALYQARLRDAKINLIRDYKKTPPLMGYGGELRQVFANLIGNAFDATRRGGKIVIRVQTAKAKGRDDGSIMVTVADTGHGMSHETKQRIFEPFFTTKGINGTGLGLWVSAEIVSKHGGRFRIRSRDGQGTAISIFFPPNHALAESSRGEVVETSWLLEGISNNTNSPTDPIDVRASDLGRNSP